MDGLLGEYDSDDDKAKEGHKGLNGGSPGSPPSAASPSSPAAASSAKQQQQRPTRNGQAEGNGEVRHGAHCMCEECEGIVARFVAKSLQTKGIRFKCRLCGEMMAAKSAAAGHFSGGHASELQAFKQQKAPNLFQASAKAASKAAPKISFAAEDVLRKRRADEDASFGGWAKKEKPEPPPCERPEYQAQIEPVLTAPPWANATKPSNDGASQMDKELDHHIAAAQRARFSRRNCLEVNPTSVRCKLCFKTIGTLQQCEQHVVDTHKEDFIKELQVWERFLFTTCKRQPPFGWVCKVCTTYFPSDGDVWRHSGKEVFIRKEERHMTAWHEKEDRWGHEEDEECCGDGMNFARGMSYDSVQRFQEAARREQEEKEAKALGFSKQDLQEESGEEDAQPAEVGVVKHIQEF